MANTNVKVRLTTPVIKVKVSDGQLIPTANPITLKTTLGANRLDGLIDVDASAESNGSILVYQANTDTYVVRPFSLEDIGGFDIDYSSANNNTILSYSDSGATSNTYVSKQLVGTASEVQLTTTATTITVGLPDDVTVSNTFTTLNANVTSAVIQTANIETLYVSNGIVTPAITVNNTIQGRDLTLSGNLTVSGTTTIINSTELQIGDNIITLNAGLPDDSNPVLSAGIQVNRGQQPDAYFIWDESQDTWSTNTAAFAAGNTSVATLAVANVATFSDSIIAGANTLVVNSTTSFVGIRNGAPTAPITIGPGGAVLTTPLIQATDNLDSYIQVAIQNLNDGPFASGDFVVTADNGTDLSKYIDLGKASSGYNYPDFSAVEALDGYLLNVDGNLSIIQGSDGEIRFFANGALAANKVATIKADAANTLYVLGGIEGTTLTGNVDASNIVSGTIANARLNSANTSQSGIVQLVDAVNNTSITIAATANAVKTAYDAAVSASGNAATAYSNAIAYSANASNISSGTLNTDRLPATANISTAINVGANVNLTTSSISVGNSTVNVSINGTTGIVTANGFSGNGASVTSVDAATVGGNTATTLRTYSDTVAGTAYANAVAIAANASNISSGTLDTSRLPATANISTAINVGANVNVTTSTISVGNSTVNVLISGTTGIVTANGFSGNGSSITSVDAATVGGNTATTLRTYSSDLAGNAYSNAVSYADTVAGTSAGTAYSNAIAYSANASNISSGTLNTDRLPATANVSTAINVGANVNVTTSSISVGNSSVNVSINGTTGIVTANGFSGNGASVTSVDAATVGGNTASTLRTYSDTVAGTAYSNAVAYSSNASNISTGTLNTDRLPATANVSTAINVGANVNVTTSSISVGNSSVNVSISGTTGIVTANGFSGNGSGITSVDASTVGGNTATTLRTYSFDLAANAYSNATTFAANASNITSGTLDTARLPATANVSTAINVGANVNLTTSSISVGNSTINTTVNSTGISANILTVANYIDFGNTAPVPSKKEGRMYYDVASKTMAYHVEEPDITMNMGQELWVRVYNDTGSTIGDGKVVYQTGAIGGIPTIGLADASNPNKVDVIGVSTHSIEDGTYGYVTAFGSVSPVDTSAFGVGDKVYLSYSSPGDLTGTSPSYPYYSIHIGEVLVDDASGKILVDLEPHFMPTLRVAGVARVGGNLTVDGNLIITGNTTSTSVTSLSVANTFIYLGGGDTVSNTNFTGSGLNDATFHGHLQYSTTTTFYVKIDGTGTPDTFAWSLDNFATTQASGVAITGNEQWLGGGALISFGATTGHTLNDKWSATLTPVAADSGVVGNYHTGEGGTYAHAGYFHDVTDYTFKFFTGYTPEPSSPINTGHASFAYANVAANTFIGTLLGTANNTLHLNGQDASYYTNLIGNAYSNATTFAANASNISSGTLNTDRLPATANVSTAINVGANVNLTTSSISVGNSTVNVSISGTTGVVTANGFSGNGSGITSVDASTVGGNTATTLRAYSDTVAGTAYSNAIAIAANASNISSGTLNTDRLPATANVSTAINVGANVNVTTSSISVGNSTVNVSISGTTGIVTANGFSGNGASVTSVDAATVGGNTASTLRTYSSDLAGNAYSNATTFAANASNISSGTLNTARLPATANVSTAINVGANVNVTTSSISVGNSTVNVYISGDTGTVTANGFSGNGASVTSVNASTLGGNSASDLQSYAANASNISSGTLNTARLPATANVSTAINVGDNVNLTTSSISVGNSSVNVSISGTTGIVTANGFSGNGSGITSVDASTVGGNTASTLRTYSSDLAGNAYSNATTFASNASNISSGTLNTARLPATANVSTAINVGTNININTSSIVIANDNKIGFKTLSGDLVAFRQQPDDNFVLYSTNTSGGERAVYSVFANSVTSKFTINVPLSLSDSLYANNSAGSAGQVLTSNGTTTYWSTVVAGSTPGGSDTYVQFNDGGDLGGTANMTFDKTTSILSIANTISVGNSTSNTVLTSNSITTQTQLSVGNSTVNAVMTPTTMLVGNSTVNAYLTTTTFALANSTNSVAMTPISITVGTSVANTTGLYSGANVFLSTTKAFVGNDTVNATVLSTSFAVANSTNTATLTPTSLTVGSSVINTVAISAPTNAYVGANVVANTSGLLIGNSSVNTTYSATQIQLANTTQTYTLTPGSISVGNSTINTVANSSQITAVNMVLSGNLTVSGTTTYVNTATLNVADNIVTLNADVVGTPTENAGIEVNRGSFANVAVRWNESGTKWQFTNDGTSYVDMASTTDAGTAYSNATSYAATIAGTAYSNAISYAATIAGTAYSNATSYAATIAGTAYSNAISYADTAAGTAYSNATTYAATIAGTAYSNATSYADTAAGTAYSNATTFAANASNISSGTLNTARLPATANVSTSINVGANVNLSTTYVFVGNTTVNATHSATQFAVANSTNTATLTPTSLTIGTQVVNTAGIYSGSNVAVTTSQLSVGNTIVDSTSIAVDNQISIGNTTINAVVNSSSIAIGNSTITGSTLSVGSNVSANVTAIFIGNSTVNTIITSNQLTLGGTISANGGVGSGGQVLTSNGSGNVYWSTVAGGSVAGSNTYVQFNDSGAANATAGFVFDKVANTLTIANTIVTSDLRMATYEETTASPTISAGSLTLDLSTATVFTVALDANITTVTINNPASVGYVSTFVIVLTADGTARTVVWPASFKWPSGTAPTLTSTLNKKDVITVFTTDGGTTYQAFTSGQNL